MEQINTPTGGKPANPINNEPVKDPVTTVVPSTVPEPSTKPEDDSAKFAGKTPEQIIEMYGEASKKIGEQGSELEKARETVGQLNVLLSVIGSDPEREKIVRRWIEDQQKPADSKPEDGEKEPLGLRKDVDDTRSVVESQIVGEFNFKYGLDKMDKDQRSAMNLKIGQALWRMIDPNEKFKNYSDVVNSIPLNKLKQTLDDAYLLANRDLVETGQFKKPADVVGGIGSISSRSLDVDQDNAPLSEKEKKAAAGMNIPEDVYKKRKLEIMKQNNE